MSEAERAKAEAHIAGCASCRTKLADLQSLVHNLAEAGRHLPDVEASVSLRRNWMTAVRKSAIESGGAPGTTPPTERLVLAWLSGRRLAWGSLAAMWTLVLFFRVSAPDAPKPTSLASAPPVSLRQVLLALKVDDRKTSHRADAQGPTPREQSPPEALPPRSQRLNLSPTDREVA